MRVTTIISHDVRDFDSWKERFDETNSFRKECGEQGATVFRSIDHPNHVTVIQTWKDAENARQFVSDQRLKRAMNESGVVGDPKIEIYSPAA